MATEEITISELELADKVLADMTLPVDTATETRAVTLKQLRAWLGSSLPTGFIIPAVGKISDARFTLLDGKTLSRAGTYEAFCNKVVSEVQAGNWFACSEDEYNSDISNYGQCGKFVVSNDYIRIPKITRFIGATITLSEIGKTYKESLPNIKGNSGSGSNVHKSGDRTPPSGAFAKGSSNGPVGGGSDVKLYNTSFNASRSSSTYQDGAKVQPDHTKYPYYMVISTEGQTESVEININKVFEDLELKANKSLSNLSAEGKSLASGFGMASRKKVPLTLGASGSIYTAPASGYFAVGIEGVQNNWITFEQGTGEFQVTFVSPSKDTSWVRGIYSIAKGETVKINYSGTSSLPKYLTFYYAQGEQ